MIRTYPKPTIGKFFLDSGAHSLYNINTKGRTKSKDRHGFFRTKGFWDYVDEYAKFVKHHRREMDYYVTVDVIYHPQLSWEVLKYLENEHGLNPVPVIHCGTPLRWLSKHLEAGYDLIGLGGLGQESPKENYLQWGDSVYDLLCSNDKRLPCVRTHGFAMTAFDLLVRYPWWSVDSSSWIKIGAYGGIYVPHKRNGKFSFDSEPYTIKTSKESPNSKKRNGHLLTLPKAQQRIILDWLEEIDIPLGSLDLKKWGVVNSDQARYLANLRFFERLCNWLPAWPWPFYRRSGKGFI